MRHQFTNEVQGNSTYLVYHLAQDEELDAVEHGMLTNNRIEGLVPTTFQQVNEQRSIKYNITSKITFLDFLEGSLKKERFLMMLSSLTKAILSTDQYMIYREHLLIDRQYIYVDTSKSEALLVCLPIAGEQEESVNLREFFRAIVCNSIYEPGEDYVLFLINYVNGHESDFSVKVFHGVINSLLKNNQKATSVHSASTGLGNKSESSEGNSSVMNRTGAAQAPNSVLSIPKQSEGKDPTTGHSGSADGLKNLFSGIFPMKSTEKNSSDKKPTEKKPEVPAAKASTPQGKIGTGMHIPGRSAERSVPEVPKKAEKKTASEKQVKRAILGIPGREKAAPVQKPEQNTILIEAEDANTPYIVRERTGERVTVIGSSFKIGKQQGLVDYLISDNKTISRNHADIIKIGEDYRLRDNNSANHSYVDGEPVAADETRKLEHMSIIRLSNENFTFYRY